MTAPKLALAALLAALALARSCGFTPDDRKGEGEPCTRTTECEVPLECRGGVCMRVVPDAGSPGDASAPFDAEAPAPDAAGADAAGPDAAAADAAEPDASGPADAGSAEAGSAPDDDGG